jgi:membrane associated rhomboid family serine protease
MSAGRRLQQASLRITRGAMILAFLEVGVSLVWLLANEPSRAQIASWLVATPDAVWRAGRVWTLLTSPLLETSFLSLLLQMTVLLSLVPTLESFWGAARLLRFAAATSLAGTVGGTLFGHLIGSEFAIAGLDPFIYAAIVAFGTIYKTRPVQFFAVLPMTGRQLMYGFLGFAALFVVLQGLWVQGAAFVSAIAVAALLLSHRFNPTTLWKRWRLKRLRRHLKVVRDEPGKWLN